MEHSGAIQGIIEGLSLQQVYLRDDLFNRLHKRGLSFTDATAIIRGEKKLADFGITDEEYENA